MSATDYTYWTKPKLLRRLHELETRIQELETECQSLRTTVGTAVDALSRENADMREWLESQERLWELQDPLDDDTREA